MNLLFWSPNSAPKTRGRWLTGIWIEVISIRLSSQIQKVSQWMSQGGRELVPTKVEKSRLPQLKGATMTFYSMEIYLLLWIKKIQDQCRVGCHLWYLYHDYQNSDQVMIILDCYLTHLLAFLLKVSCDGYFLKFGTKNI